MKPENERLGRCESCRFWKSYSEMLAERVGVSPSPSELNVARTQLRRELSPNNLDVGSAEKRGWCLAAERGEACPSTVLAINMVNHDIVRMVTESLFGCLCYQPRPSRAMAAPAPNFDQDENLGRCAGCNQWSGALNEALALFSQERLTNPSCKMVDAQREAMALLSPPPLDPGTAMLRGWCKSASFVSAFSSGLVVDPRTGAVGGLITSRDHACTRFNPIMSPVRRTRPGARLLAKRDVEHVLGPSASLDSLLFSYMDPATLIDPAHPLSPLHAEHPLNRGNALSPYYNPVPAFAAYILNPSMVNTISDRAAIHQGQELGREAGLSDRNRPRISMAFTDDPSLVRPDPSQEMENPAPQKGNMVKTLSRVVAERDRQLLAQARLAKDFSERTIHGGRGGGDFSDETEGRRPVSLLKASDDPSVEPEESVEGNRRKKNVFRHGFVDRRQTLD